MPAGQMNDVMRYIRKMVGGPSPDDATDRQLLERYTSTRDEGSFQAIVDRHGSMVLGVCRRLLQHPHDAEGAFQATFLVLVRKAQSIGHAELLGNWLYGVAHRVALDARRKASRWNAQLTAVPNVALPQADCEAERRELHVVLDEELSRLAQKYRSPVVLCYLEGKTNDEAARELGWPKGTVFSRLARARELLRLRLGRRGLAVTGTAFTMHLTQSQASAAIPSRLLFSTIEAANAIGAGEAGTGGVISPKVVSLLEGALRAMFLHKLKTAATFCFALLFLVAGAALWTQGALRGTPTNSDSEAASADEAVTELPPALPPIESQLPNLKYSDGQADGKKSLGGSGEMMEFTLPAGNSKVSGLRIHGSRYGQPQAPNESFLIFFLNKDMSEVIRTEMAPYSLFDRGKEQWVEIKFRRPVEVPEHFWVALDFRPGRTKGVYVSYDTSTGGKYSRLGLPGFEATPTDFGGDWMIEVMLVK